MFVSFHVIMEVIDTIRFTSYNCTNVKLRGVSSMKADEGILVGRPFGGIAILLRNALASHVVVDVINDRIMTATVKCGVQVFIAINVYMPYDDRSEHSENYELFMSTLRDIIMYAEVSPTSYVVIIGDWNSNVSSPSIFGREMLNFCT